MAKKTADLIAENGYEDILIREGWKALKKTVSTNHGEATATRILKVLEKLNDDRDKVMKKAESGTVLNPCRCGCGTMVKNRFSMGHDARLKGRLTRIIYWNKATVEHPVKPTDAQVEDALARMADEGWSYRVDQKRADQAARIRAGEVAGLKAGESVKYSERAIDSVLKKKSDPASAIL